MVALGRPASGGGPGAELENSTGQDGLAPAALRRQVLGPAVPRASALPSLPGSGTGSACPAIARPLACGEACRASLPGGRGPPRIAPCRFGGTGSTRVCSPAGRRPGRIAQPISGIGVANQRFRRDSQRRRDSRAHQSVRCVCVRIAQPVVHVDFPAAFPHCEAGGELGLRQDGRIERAGAPQRLAEAIFQRAIETAADAGQQAPARAG